MINIEGNNTDAIIISIKNSLFDIFATGQETIMYLKDQLKVETDLNKKQVLERQIEQKEKLLSLIATSSKDLVKYLEELDLKEINNKHTNNEMVNNDSVEVGLEEQEIKNDSRELENKQDLVEQNLDNIIPPIPDIEKPSTEVTETSELEKQTIRNEIAEDKKIEVGPLPPIALPNTEIEENKENTVENPSEDKMVFVQLNPQSVRAILVTREQLQRLELSKNNQENLLKTRGSMVSEISEKSSEVEKVPDEGEKTFSSYEEAEELLKNGQLEPNETNIQAMMTLASNLYENGKQEEAQKVYTMIRQLNKQTQK